MSVPAVEPTDAPAEDPKPTPPSPPTDKPSDDLGDAGTKAIAAERKARKDAERKATELAAKVDEFEKAKLSEKERAERELADAKKAADEAKAEAARYQLDALRHRIAAEKNVPAALLAGKDEESLTASADAAIAWRGTGTPEPPKAPKADPSVGARGGDQAPSGKDLYHQSHPKRTATVAP